MEKENKKHFIPRSIKTNLILLIGGGLINNSGIFNSPGNGLFITLNFIAVICEVVGLIGTIRWIILKYKKHK